MRGVAWRVARRWASVRGSWPAVGSSRRRTGALVRRARARATRRRSPPERSLPCSPTWVSGVGAAAAARAWRTAASGASGRARRTLSATVPANRPGRCGTQAKAERQAAGVKSRCRWGPAETMPHSGSVKPRRTDEGGRLAGAARAGEDDELPRLDLQVREVQRWAVRVPHGDSLHPQRNTTQVGRFAPAAPLRRRGVEDGEDSLGGGQAVRTGVELGAELAQRQVGLGSEDEHQQAGLQPEPALDQP